jgi:type III pantothenate kinase
MTTLAGFDIGNTSTLMGLYPEGAAVPSQLFRYPTEKNASPERLCETIINFLDKNLSVKPAGMALTSVVPEIVPSYRKLAAEEFGLELLSVSYESPLSITLRYDHPEKLGPDRITNAEAAFREHGGSVIIDIGTAITYCVVTPDGIYEGGLIAPGPGTGMKALAAAASMLPEVKIEQPPAVTAKNTVHAIQSGIWHGWCAMINGLTEMITAEHRHKLKIIITGGFAEPFSRGLKYDVMDPLLTMKGIGYIYGNSLRIK